MKNLIAALTLSAILLIAAFGSTTLISAGSGAGKDWRGKHGGEGLER